MALFIGGLVAPAALTATAQAYYVDVSITGAGRVYETTDANEIDEHCPDAIEGFASPSTTPTGTVGAICRAGDASGDYAWNWVVRYVAAPAAGYRFAGWSSDGRTNPGPVICDGSGGSSNHSGAACQFATTANLQTQARFVDDTDPAMASLTGPNQVVSGAATFTFSAAADATLRHFECRVAGVHEWQTCGSGRQEDPTQSGTYTFQVRAVDHSGNRSAESTWQWTVDKIAPETSVGAGPTGTVQSTSATFEFSSNEQGSFACSLDDAAFTSCSSPKSYSALEQGPHTFAVRAIDAAGNMDASPVTREWVVDTVAPDTAITGGPAQDSTTESTSATFEFSSTESGSFECALDSGAYAPCTSPVALSGLGVGSHTFRVRARDGSGNADASPATRTWTVRAPAGTGAGTGTGTGTGMGAQTGTEIMPPPAPAFRPRFTHAYKNARGRTRLTTLRITALQAGTKLTVTCSGGRAKGCAFTRKLLTSKGTSANLGKLVSKLRLEKGAVLKVRAASTAGEVKLSRYLARGNRAPKVTYSCATKGAKLRPCT